jgi:D-hydroxyproline dehydrogenase subunit alpha
VNEFQETTVKGIFCAGEPTMIGGVDLALVEGQIAGMASSEHSEESKTLFGHRDKARRFARLLDATFQLRDELRKLPQVDTIVCRCEDVVHSRMQQHSSWRSAKLQTRCGMGPCQGRVCGPAAQFLYGWSVESVRPPVFPARLESLAVVGADSGTGGAE